MSEENNDGMATTPANFVEPEQEGVVYIQPNIEINLTDKQRHACREIVREIKNFGVNQRQLMFLIGLLSLELEDVQLTRTLRQAIVDARQKLNDKPKLIIPTDQE